MVALAPFGDPGTQGRIIEDGLDRAARNLQTLLDSRAIRRAHRVAAVNFVLGNALLTLGGRESGNERLGQAAEFCRSSLEAYVPSADLKQWAAVQNNLANDLPMLGDHQGRVDRVREAIELYVPVLDEQLHVGYRGSRDLSVHMVLTLKRNLGCSRPTAPTGSRSTRAGLARRWNGADNIYPTSGTDNLAILRAVGGIVEGAHA